MPDLVVISGGQTGVDQVGLKVAKDLGYRTGGTAPKGWRTDAGSAPWLKDYGLKEDPSSGYHNRTIQNIMDSDMTVWFGTTDSPGAILTLRRATIEQQRRTYYLLINPTADDLMVYLGSFFVVRVLNVAGNRLRTNPQAAQTAAVVLREALTV